MSFGEDEEGNLFVADAGASLLYPIVENASPRMPMIAPAR